MNFVGASIVTEIRRKLDSRWEKIQSMDRESKDNEAIHEYLAGLTLEDVKRQTRLNLPEVENFYQKVLTTLHTRQVRTSSKKEVRLKNQIDIFL